MSKPLFDIVPSPSPVYRITVENITGTQHTYTTHTVVRIYIIMYWTLLLRSLQVESKQGNKNEIKKGMLLYLI